MYENRSNKFTKVQRSLKETKKKSFVLNNKSFISFLKGGMIRITFNKYYYINKTTKHITYTDRTMNPLFADIVPQIIL